MKDRITLEFIQAAIIRAIKTAAQTALSLITVGSAMNEVAWKTVISVSLVAAIYSLLTSIAGGLPETSDDGTLSITETNPGAFLYSLNTKTDPEVWKKQKSITLKVNNQILEENTDGKANG